jgi:hypothetical protein
MLVALLFGYWGQLNQQGITIMEKTHHEDESDSVASEVSNRRKRFFPTVSLGNILTGVVILGGCLGVYTSTIADVRELKTDVANTKQAIQEQKVIESTSRREIKEDIRDVKKDVGEVRETLQKVLFELQKRERNNR